MIKTNFSNVLSYFALLAIAYIGPVQELKAQAPEPNIAEVQKATILTVVKNLKENHVHPKAIDDNFSKIVWKKFLEGLDPNRDILLKSDFDELKRYELSIDNELNNGQLNFFTVAFERYQKRLNAAADGYKKALAKPFNFNKTEFVQLNGKLNTYATTEAELARKWELRAKYMVLKKMFDLDKSKMNSPELEKQARAKVDRWLTNNFKTLTGPLAQKDKFSQYLNTATLEVEAHTQYFPPIQVKNMDARAAKHFFGVGLELQDKEGDIYIRSLRPGGMAIRSGQVDIDDRVISVSNATGQMVDVVGMPILEVAELVKGDKDTEVALGLLKANGKQKTITLTRAEINEDESRARSAIIQKAGKKIGYLYLREFYVDINNSKSPRAAIDVYTELLKLTEAKVDGIVFDLRNNPGGSMDEVVVIAGYFLGKGPKVLVKEMKALHTPTTHDEAIYTGPLVVMVNEHSASASELFAAVIQDHKRGLIVGAPASFGKGTAQPTVPMGKMGNKTKGIPAISYGSLRISQYQFYRVTGASTQSRGVLSDVILPGKLAYLKSREKDRESALLWDSIPPADYKPFYDGNTWNKMKKLGGEAIGSINSFKIIDENSKLLAEAQLKPFSLKPTEFVKQQQTLLDYIQKIDDTAILPEAKRLKVTATPGYDAPEKEWYPKWTKELSKDIYIDKTLDIINRVMTFK
jgi:carboxyl-terminal processing protease